MKQFPKPLTKGPPFLKEAIRKRDEWAKTTQVRKGRGTSIEEIKGQGRKVHAHRSGRGGSVVYELQIFAADPLAPGELPRVGVRWGTLNQYPPSNFSAGVGEPIFLEVALGENVVFLAVETDEVTLAVTDVLVWSAAAMPDNDTNLAYDRLGNYSFDGETGLEIVSVNAGSRYYVNGNGEHYFWR